MKDRDTVIAIFSERSQAQRAIEELKRGGFTEEQIGITARDDESEQARGRSHEDQGESHAKEGAVAGLATGAGVGALWGLGILAGVLPGIGTAIAGGTLAALLSSAAAGAATAGLAGALIGLGIPEEEAEFADQEFRSGRIVVTVQADGRGSEAMSILQRSGGYDMRSAPGGRESAAAARSSSGQRTIEAREEELSVHKRPVQTGEVDVRKEVHTEHRTLEVPVRKEEVVVERHAVDRRTASGAMDEGAEEVRIPISEEQVEIEKRPVVTEEVTVGKRSTERQERIGATVRKEEVKVEKRGGSNTRPPAR